MSRGSKPLPFTTIGEAFYSGAREWIRRVCGSAGFTLTISYEVGRALAIIHSCYESTIDLIGCSQVRPVLLEARA